MMLQLTFYDPSGSSVISGFMVNFDAMMPPAVSMPGLQANVWRQDKHPLARICGYIASLAAMNQLLCGRRVSIRTSSQARPRRNEGPDGHRGSSGWRPAPRRGH